MPGFHTVEIEATDERHRSLPLWHEVFSTKDPDYPGWYETIARAVLARTGRRATWPSSPCSPSASRPTGS